MEAPAQYGPTTVRPRLTVVKDDGASFSALPHAVMRRADLAPAVRLLYAILQGYAWQGSECRASHETLAGELGCSLRMLRTYLDRLMDAGLVTEHDAGYRRQKLYRLVPIGTVLPIGTVNENPASDSNGVNRKFPTVQSEISDTSNRKHSSDSKKKTPEKKTKEEELPTTWVGAALAADQPAEGTKPKRSSRGTRCPESFDLTEKHLAYAATLGFGGDEARAETDKFLAHHRFKGTLGVDWYAGWQNWLRKAVTFAAERASKPASQQRSNGAAPYRTEAGREQTRQHSKWSDPHWDRVMGGAAMRGGARDKEAPRE